ncbi:helix-turn-helix domain-containing protein [Nocardia goodfellowii]
MSEHPSAEIPRTDPPRLRAIPGGRDHRPRDPQPEISGELPALDRRSPAPVDRHAPAARDARPRPVRELLWREALGQRLRALRQEQRETLAETAGRAGVSPQYLSEVERGLKEPSSEMIAAMAGALDVPLGGLIHQVADDLFQRQRPTLTRSAGPRANAPYNGLLLAA